MKTPTDGELTPHTEGGEAMTNVAMTTFRLYGQLMEVAQQLAAEGGITAAWWQVLGGIVDEPRTIPDIGRRMGITRQGVQRVHREGLSVDTEDRSGAAPLGEPNRRSRRRQEAAEVGRHREPSDRRPGSR
jgi:hypothetical protein